MRTGSKMLLTSLSAKSDASVSDMAADLLRGVLVKEVQGESEDSFLIARGVVKLSTSFQSRKDAL